SPGTNTLEIKGKSLHIAGGFIKITYNSDVMYEEPTRYYFPGIQGIINLYDGFYVPGNLTSLAISLHFNNTVETFLSIGKTKVFNSTSDGTTVTITDATLSSLLDYDDLSKKTIPIRFGMEDMEYLTNNSNDIDVFSATDISGSMRYECSGESNNCCNAFVCNRNQDSCEFCGGTLVVRWWGSYCSGESASCCEALECNTNETSCTSCGGTVENKIQDAKDANELFIDMILNDTKNRVGLTAYSTSALDSNYHALSNDSASLKSEVVSWNEGGWTCICCGINKAVAGLVADSNSSKFRSIVMMSDGDSNQECAEQGTGDANNDAIQAACDAYTDHNISVYTIGFGTEANVLTLTQMASCADGSFYSAIDELEDIYEKIAKELIETAYYEQTVEVSGDFFSELFSDSYIEFEYEKEPLPVGLVTTIEQQFQEPGNASFTLPPNSTLLEATAISYSGPQWTSDLIINNISAYNLSAYEEDFLKLGDPYSLNIPIELTNQANSVQLKIGLASDNLTNGSINNKIIYTISKELSSYTSVSATAEGCNWTLEFDTYNLTTQIPSNYIGSEECKFTSPEKYCDIYSECTGATDATQLATYNLFKLLDFDLDGIIDIELTQENMEISTSNLEGVPFLFSTEVQIRKWH
ncbi:VWA domain-containing protein, partial [Candidatus Peregrinibacteria bacterium]|nr:VWA domain-containing protein [Candidatus Peregrinibacteria bacterium]